MAELERSEVLHRNPVTQQGFTMMPNAVLTASRLSSGARLLYGLLKMHAWQADNAFPGQERLAGYLGVSTRQVRTYQTELETAGLITIEQRGLRQTNRYWIEDIPAAFLSDRNSTSDQDRNPASDQDRNSTSDKEDSAVKKTQGNKRETPAQATGDISLVVQSGTPVNKRPDAPPKQLRPVPVACPPDFTLTSEDRLWAQTNVAALYPQVAVYTRMFITHYTVGKGKDERDTNWRGRWQMWMLRQLTDFGGGARTAGASGPAPRPYTVVSRGA